MDQILNKSFDFSIRSIELVKYLDEEKRPFPLCGWLLSCATEMGISLRLAGLTDPESVDTVRQALHCAVEAEYLLEIMVKTGCLREKQNLPILSDCRALKELILGRLYEKQLKIER